MRSEPGDVISFWIADGDTSPEALKRVSKTWYRSKPAFDDEIRTRFGDTLALAEQGDLPEWRGDAEGELANREHVLLELHRAFKVAERGPSQR